MRGFWRTLATAFLAAATGAAGVALAGGTAQAAKFKVLHSFCCRQGSNPQWSLITDQNGNLFGTTPIGGSASKGTTGTAFELVRRPSGGYKFKILYQFFRGGPSGPLILDSDGSLYGTVAPEGGGGAIFKLSPSTDKKRWTETVLYQFCSQQNCTDGNFPIGGLTYAGASTGASYDGTSPLYGVSQSGGANNGGTVFQLTKSSGNWSETVLYSFCSTGGDKCTDGKGPFGGLLVDKSGNLFGTALEGGGAQGGTAFELSSSNETWNFTLLYTFCSTADCTDGAGPDGPLVFDSSGDLFGTTGGGGAKCSQVKDGGCGTIFRLSSAGNGWHEMVLHSFCQKTDCKDGSGPGGGVLIDALGNLFGTTATGGGNDTSDAPLGGGTAFELSSSSFKILHKFCSVQNCADGERPEAGFTADGLGNLLGTTTYGGIFADSNFGGTVFKVRP